MGALQEIKHNGLPQDFEKIAAKEALLKPFPTNLLKKFIRKSMKRYIGTPEDPLDLEKFYITTMVELHQFSSEKLRFGDWKYVINSIYKWDLDELIIEIVARKMNMKASLSITKTLIINENYNTEEDGVYYKEPRNYFKAPKAKAVLRDLYKLLDEAEMAIKQWNWICMKTKPIINAKPPLDSIGQLMKDSFLDDIVEFEWDSFKPKDDEHFYDGNHHYKDFNHFMEEHAFPLSYLIYYSLIDFEIDFGTKPKFSLWVDYWEDPYDGWMGYNIYLSIERVKVNLIVYEEEIHVWSEIFYAEELPEIISGIIKSVYDSIIQWNKVILKGG